MTSAEQLVLDLSNRETALLELSENKELFQEFIWSNSCFITGNYINVSCSVTTKSNPRYNRIVFPQHGKQVSTLLST